MKLISKKQYLIEEIIKRTKKYYNRDVVELNDILYKHNYFESTNRSWEQFVKSSRESKLKLILEDLIKSKL